MNLQRLLELVTDDGQRLALFEDVERALLLGEGHNMRMREAAGLLAANLAQAMDKPSRHTADIAVQEAFFRRSIRIFPESAVATRSLGFKLEQIGQELQAIELYREALGRTSPERLDLRLLLASACSPFLDDDASGDLRSVLEINAAIIIIANSLILVDYSGFNQYITTYLRRLFVVTFMAATLQVFEGIWGDPAPHKTYSDARQAPPQFAGPRERSGVHTELFLAVSGAQHAPADGGFVLDPCCYDSWAT